MKSVKEDFLAILSSATPEEITELIFKNSKIKPLSVVTCIKGYQNN